MPFFFLYLYENNNIMAKKNFNKDLERGKKLLADQVAEVGYLDDAFKSLAAQIKDAFQELADNLDGNLDITDQIAKSYERDVLGSIKKMARSLESNISLQNKLNKGQNISKQIENEKNKLLVRQSKTQEQINKVFGKGSTIAEKLNTQLDDAYDLQIGNLDALENQNKERIKNTSLLKIGSGILSNMAMKIDKSGTLSEALKGNFSEVFTFARLGELAMANLVVGLIQGVLELDKLQTQYNKSFGMTDVQAAAVQSRMSNIADASGRTSMTFFDMHKVMGGIGEATGVLATGLRDDVVEEAAELQKLLGLSNKGVAMLAFNAQVTGQNMEAQSIAMTKGVKLASQELGIRIKASDVIKEVSETSGIIRANFGRNVGLMSEVTAKAKAFGLTLNDLASISKNLLNFHSSIEAELTAELFTGKQLNLEKARLYALTGDYKGLMDEIVGQMGSEYEFLNMNVLAKEKYAAALGMSVDQMSDLIFKEGDLAAIKEQATLNNDEDTLNMLKQRDLSQKMADIMTKVQTTFITIAEGPIGAMASVLGEVLQDADALKTILYMIGAVKIAGLITSVVSLGTALGATTLLGATTVGVLTLGIGLAAATLAIGTFMAGVEREKAKMETGGVKLAEGGIVTKETQATIGEAGPEAVIPLDQFNAKLDELIEETRLNRPIAGRVLAAWETKTRWQ